MTPLRAVRRRYISVAAGVLVIAAIVALAGLKTQRPAASVKTRKAPAAHTHLSYANRSSPQQIDPALFNPGSCMVFPPTHGDQHETVFLDAGHGGIDPGVVGSTENGAAIDEATVNLRIELDVMGLLRDEGYRVVVSRTEQTTVVRLGPGDESDHELTVQGVHADVTARPECADKAGANVLVGIYMNGGYYGEAGCLTAYDPDRPFAAANLRLATLLQNDVLTALNKRGLDIPNGGVTSDTELGSAVSYAALNYPHLLLLGPAQRGYFSTPSQMPGALIEPLFLTDPFEASVAASTQGQQLIAGGIAQAVGQYFAASGATGSGSTGSGTTASGPTTSTTGTSSTATR
jgi:N-acetylmuramoyl-L-alanine amidase